MATPDKKQLIDQQIEASRDQGPAEARLVNSGVPVWIVVDHYQIVGRDVERVAEDYDIPPAAVVAALAYFEEHQTAIAARIEAHHAAFAA